MENYTIPLKKYAVFKDNPRQQVELERAYSQSKGESKENIKHYQSGSRQKVWKRSNNRKILWSAIVYQR